MRTPKEIILSVEDNIDHPAHDINERLADKALAALEAEGYAIVPREPTEEMLQTGADEAHCPVDVMRAAWQFMLAAAVGETSNKEG